MPRTLTALAAAGAAMILAGCGSSGSSNEGDVFATDKPVADELNATAEKFRAHAMKNGITQEKGGQLMKTFSDKFSAAGEQRAIRSLDFYAVNCMRSAFSMGMTTMDVSIAAIWFEHRCCL